MGVFDTVDINIRGQVGEDCGEEIENLIEMICKSHGLDCDIKGGCCASYREEQNDS